jgi:hypothetical protein
MGVTVSVLGPGDRAVLDRVAEGVFDRPVDDRWATEFLADPRHHLAVAVEGGQIVGLLARQVGQLDGATPAVLRQGDRFVLKPRP